MDASIFGGAELFFFLTVNSLPRLFWLDMRDNEPFSSCDAMCCVCVCWDGWVVGFVLCLCAAFMFTVWLHHRHTLNQCLNTHTHTRTHTHTHTHYKGWLRLLWCLFVMKWCQPLHDERHTTWLCVNVYLNDAVYIRKKNEICVFSSLLSLTHWNCLWIVCKKTGNC
jgi:hypothetical protein